MSVENLKQSAANGSLVLHLEDGAITKIINACEDYVRALGQLKQHARALSTYPLGFAEAHLDSGAKLAQAFQEKAAGSITSAEATFQSHIDQVEEMKSLFAALQGGYKSMDANNSRGFGPHGS
ncbi:hypothetical protein [Mycobacteroides chelonae]|jgi:hypothetical protein|uniref:Uncharacterized protein n=2 Tax=Mycobacteroides chelonae TaxID=1774 RepID=A0AB73LH44_MYCCH|nr:hypothetical protein [Mycobacteroides chelonae]MBF9327642.1 hypothetical protein [Mycobacteroides chelonae]MBF9421820.1 hypothetical protein [Mycobacteroides chelonae]MBF9435990.1 hypothetical protein [Mycobacteroides chelonae]MBV6361732.1 hypothetical protein [Mycobacteroides chelonae]MEC4837636.1 hypothetical protein [Mycobacteroides chelonae]